MSMLFKNLRSFAVFKEKQQILYIDAGWVKNFLFANSFLLKKRPLGIKSSLLYSRISFRPLANRLSSSSLGRWRARPTRSRGSSPER
jgi:hypothetical protein